MTSGPGSVLADAGRKLFKKLALYRMHVMRVLILRQGGRGRVFHFSYSGSGSVDVAATSCQGAGAATLLKGALKREVESKRRKARGTTAVTKYLLHQLYRWQWGLSSAPPIPAGIWSFQWNRIWQKALLIYLFECFPFWWNSGGFQNLHQNVHQNGQEQNSAGIHSFICNA